MGTVCYALKQARAKIASVCAEEFICGPRFANMNMFSWRLSLYRCDLYLFISLRTVVEKAGCIFVFLKCVCMSGCVCALV